MTISRTGQAALLLATVCAFLTAVSAYIAGTTLKTLLMRVLISAISAGLAGAIAGSWLQIKLLKLKDEKDDAAVGQTVDIAVSDDTPGEIQWQPLEVERISQEDQRVFSTRK